SGERALLCEWSPACLPSGAASHMPDYAPLGTSRLRSPPDATGHREGPATTMGEVPLVPGHPPPLAPSDRGIARTEPRARVPTGGSGHAVGWSRLYRLDSFGSPVSVRGYSPRAQPAHPPPTREH